MKIKLLDSFQRFSMASLSEALSVHPPPEARRSTTTRKAAKTIVSARAPSPEQRGGCWQGDVA